MQGWEYCLLYKMIPESKLSQQKKVDIESFQVKEASIYQEYVGKNEEISKISPS